MTAINPVAVMAAHTPWPSTTWCPVCTDLSHGGPYVRPPCEPYRLAEALKAEQEKVLRVELQARIYALNDMPSVAETFRRAVVPPERRRVHPDFLLDPDEDEAVL